MSSSPRVTELWVYPIKSCAGTRVSSSEVGLQGLVHDRRFMLVDQDGRMLSQRQEPALACVATTLSRDRTHLDVSSAGSSPLRVPIATGRGRLRQAEMFGEVLDVLDSGPEPAAWFSRVLNRRAHLVEIPPGRRRTSGAPDATPRLFADTSSVTVLSTASVRRLNSHLEALGNLPLATDRFRPNIVIDGCHAAHWEDEQKLLTVGGCGLSFAMRIERCMVTMVDQESGVRSGPEPIRTLARYRRLSGGGVLFAAGYAVRSEGVLREGDSVRPTPAMPSLASS